MSDKFEAAVKIVQELPKDGPVQPSSTDQLEFYGWYKTVTVGAVNVTRPGMLDFTGKAKWDAWKAAETTAPEECKKKYVEKLIGLLEKADDEDSKKHLAALQ